MLSCFYSIFGFIGISALVAFCLFLFMALWMQVWVSVSSDDEGR